MIGEFINGIYQSVYQWFAEPGDKHKYLLSATAQTLGAIFAIVFAITPIVVQQLSRYISKPLRYVFKPRMLAYIAGFAIAITTPLWCLIKPGGLGSFISLVLGSGFVFSLIWYFWYILKKSDVDRLMYDLKDESLASVAVGKFKDAEDRINSLDGIITRSLSYGEYKVLDQAVKETVRLAMGIEEKTGTRKVEKGTEERRLHARIFEVLRSTCYEVIDKSRAAIKIISAIGVAATEAVLKDLGQTETSAQHAIVTISKFCTKETRILLSIQCFTSLYWMVSNFPPKSPMIDLVKHKAKTLQDYYIDDMLQIQDIHLEKGWQDWLEWLLQSTVALIPEFEPSDWVREEILKNIWLTDARFDEPNTKWLYRLLEKNGMIENFLNEELHNSAVEKGRKLGIPEDKLNARWGAFQKHKDWKNGKFGYEVGPPEE